VPVTALVLFAGVAPPISMASRTPVGSDPLMSSSAVTTAKPWLFVPRSGSIAIAMGDVSTEIVIALRVVGAVPEAGKSSDKSI
jgi:hypothetical protein